MARRKKKSTKLLDYHEGLSPNQVEIILRAFDLDVWEFNEWLYGQTGPLIHRFNRDTGKEERIGGIYEYDLFRWISSQKKGTPLIWD